ncbi:protein tyrosine phosphatase family protein [uncultured Roseobacter sp.]|uniref:protein tyrosine phosphatase family protein n=1 Tax=uncultured Roseobacter sp. TaxID=114847 RepID=UPI0026399666|nr:protein tyrosine phosphatase family protein [uncultured Roseobacter sp.]
MKDPDDILNWRRINARLTTSGQPDALQLADIQRLGVTHIVNTGPGHGEGALETEAETVARLGMVYIHIPVDFENPTDQNFEDFRSVLEANSDKLIHVHCIYNARVSAFFYRYAKTNNEVSDEQAFEIMESIWRPGSDWAEFIGDQKAENVPNQYAGEDY